MSMTRASHENNSGGETGEAIEVRRKKTQRLLRYMSATTIANGQEEPARDGQMVRRFRFEYPDDNYRLSFNFMVNPTPDWQGAKSRDDVGWAFELKFTVSREAPSGPIPLAGAILMPMAYTAEEGRTLQERHPDPVVSLEVLRSKVMEDQEVRQAHAPYLHATFSHMGLDPRLLDEDRATSIFTDDDGVYWETFHSDETMGIARPPGWQEIDGIDVDTFIAATETMRLVSEGGDLR